MKIVTVLGARPQFIKAATVSRAIQEYGGVQDVLIHTGQHFDDNMSDIFFRELKIPAPVHNLGIGGGSHGQNTGRMLEGIERVLMEEMPDWVLVYGDTDSTLAGALAAVKLQLPLAHVESGLRSFNRAMPEEINRVLTDHSANILFTPTDQATSQLRMEGIAPEQVRQVGDVMYDAALYHGERASESRVLQQNGLEANNFVLATIHRQENTDDVEALRTIFEAFGQISAEIPLVLPLHPRTKARLDSFGLGSLTKGITLIEPLGYLDMIVLERNAAVIATDSGGVQKEAYFQEVPCITLRTETEWTELVALGWNKIVPPASGTSAIVSAILDARGTHGQEAFPYGRGEAAREILRSLVAE